MTINPEGLPDALRAYARQNFGADQIWSALSGGRSNQSWRLVTNGASWVFKLFDQERSNSLFPNDPIAETAALKALKGTGLAPDFLSAFTTDAGVCLVYQYIPATPTHQTDAATIRTLARLHKIAAPEVRRLEITPHRLMQHGQKFRDGLTPEHSKKLSAHFPEPGLFPAGPDVFLHGDPVPANVLATDSTRLMIDWQCPAIGDATADLAIALSPAMHVVYGREGLTPAQEMEALHAYPDAAVIERYLLLKPFFHWRMAAYCAWKSARGEAVYEQAFEVEISQI